MLTMLLQALCAVLEYEICDNNDVKMQIITTLQITSRGKRMYADLCERQIQLRELVSCADFLNSSYSAYVSALIRRLRGNSMYFATLYNWTCQVSLGVMPSKCMPPPLQHSRIFTHDLWLLTTDLENLSAVLTCMNFMLCFIEILDYVLRYCIMRNRPPCIQCSVVKITSKSTADSNSSMLLGLWHLWAECLEATDEQRTDGQQMARRPKNVMLFVACCGRWRHKN